MKLDFALILIISSICNGRAFRSTDNNYLVKRASTSLIDAYQRSDLHGEKARRQNAWDRTTGQLTTVYIDSDGDTFELSIHAYLGHTIPIGTYITSRHRTKQGATLGDFPDDVLRTQQVASIGTYASDSNAGKADAAVIALVKKNAQAAYSSTLDLLNNEILCPGIDDSHDELRKLLQSTGNYYRAVVFKSLVAGFATLGMTWYLDNRPNTTIFTKRSIIAGSVAASVVFSHGILDDIARRDAYTAREAIILNAISSWLSRLCERAGAKWKELKAATVECFELDEANQNAANFPAVVNPDLQIDNNIPAGEIPPNQGVEQSEQPGDCIV